MSIHAMFLGHIANYNFHKYTQGVGGKRGMGSQKDVIQINSCPLLSFLYFFSSPKRLCGAVSLLTVSSTKTDITFLCLKMLMYRFYPIIFISRSKLSAHEIGFF